jgi:WD40 repeat protein
MRIHTARVNGVAFSRDDRTLASASFDGTIKLTDLTLPDPHGMVNTQMIYCLNISFSPDSRWLVGTSALGMVRVFDTMDGSTVASYEDQASIGAAYFTPDLRYLVWCCKDTIRQWDWWWAGEGMDPETITPDVHCGSFGLSGDLRWLVGYDANHSIRVWHWPSLKHHAILTGHQSEVETASISPDGQTAVSAGQDTTLKLWNLRTSAEIFTLRGHSDRPHAVVFSPDGKMIASSGLDPEIRLWEKPQGTADSHLAGA